MQYHVCYEVHWDRPFLGTGFIILLDHSSDFPLPSSIILHTSSNWSLSKPLFYTSAGISSMPGAFLLANVLMLVLSSSKVSVLVLIGIVSCTVYKLGSCLRPLVGLRVWKNRPSIFSSLTSAVLPLRRPVADEVLSVISLIVSHILFA